MKLFTRPGARPPEPPPLVIDWQQPILVFDPWPFTPNHVPRIEAYFLNDEGSIVGKLAERSLTRWYNVLATATDGHLVVTNEESLRRHSEITP